MDTWSRDYFSRYSWHIFSGQIMQGGVGGEIMEQKKKGAKDLLKALESPPLKISNPQTWEDVYHHTQVTVAEV